MIVRSKEWWLRRLAGEPDCFIGAGVPDASGIEAGTDETAQPVRPEGREPGPKGDAR